MSTWVSRMDNCLSFHSISPRNSKKMADDVYAYAYGFSSAFSLDISVCICSPKVVAFPFDNHIMSS